ncbi:hypothetical protein BRE01_62330 [Brevibacillus reuszeri]|uniref:Competence protein CoiA nuclease-like domain-containing protein n=1 Tax=Brevibacillus reuszeri TaxID=54915 RepID=A0A0K9YXF6_9BACL|nr:competence protein CoiA family protein [Brevibacillus reuszeri]KNB72930.1 hypothetical protein ADS79_13975 [Brevibacillus reuszeri]GED72531.1 hypothetical protein BRE01_62330 [Brevibacillus reuszeri]
MLTCKVGETIINCHDNSYDKYTLKKWSDKNKLKCPDCNKTYEYCHGDIVLPYFRHKEKSKECDEIYSEPESEEHIKGKMIIHNWLLNMQNQGIIKNLHLEYYLPSTKQRPDIYFELENNKYVIEFQCTPIATEYFERRELYRLAGVNDLWILGMKKYNLVTNGSSISHSSYYKTIEKHSNIYLDVDKLCFYVSSSMIKSKLPYKLIYLNDYYGLAIDDFEFSKESNSIVVKQHSIQNLIEDDMNAAMLKRKKLEISKQLDSVIHKVVDNLNSFFQTNIDATAKFHLGSSNRPLYLKSILFENKNSDRTIFIKQDSIDYCKKMWKSVVVGRGKRGGPKWGQRIVHSQISSIKTDDLDASTICRFITNAVINDFVSYKKKHDKQQLKTEINAIMHDFLDSEIVLTLPTKEVSNNVRFKLLRGFSQTDEYMRNIFINELRFLKRKKVDKYVFMIPNYNPKITSCTSYHHNLINFFISYGFTNVRILDESEESY